MTKSQRARILAAEHRRVVGRARQLVAADIDAARQAVVAEARVRVADAAEQIDAGRRAQRPSFELDALALRGADVGDVELRGHERIRHVQLEIVPVDVEDRGVGRARGRSAQVVFTPPSKFQVCSSP